MAPYSTSSATILVLMLMFTIVVLFHPSSTEAQYFPHGEQLQWKEKAPQRKCTKEVALQRIWNTIEEFAPPHKIRESTTSAIHGLFSFSTLLGKVDQRKAKANTAHSRAPQSSQTSKYLDKCLKLALGGTKAGYVCTYGLRPIQVYIYSPSSVQSKAQKRAFEIEVNSRVKDAINSLEKKNRQYVEQRIWSELEASMQAEIEKSLNSFEKQMKSFMEQQMRQSSILAPNADSQQGKLASNVKNSEDKRRFGNPTRKDFVKDKICRSRDVLLSIFIRPEGFD